MFSDGFNPRILKICAYTGLFFAFLWPFAATVVADFQYILPPSAADSAAEVVSDYEDSTNRIRVCATLMIFASMFYTTFGMGISMLTRHREGRWPILYHLQLVSLACCVVVVMFIGFFWGCASWRVGDVDPDVTQALNDLGWLGVLYTGAPFAVYMAAIGASVLMDRSERPAFPRWYGYFNLFCVFFMVEASLLLFFKTGAFSQDGVAVFWCPMVVFFAWIVISSILVIQSVNREVAARAAAGDHPIDQTITATTNGIGNDNGHGVSVEELAAELHQVRAELAKVANRN